MAELIPTTLVKTAALSGRACADSTDPPPLTGNGPRQPADVGDGGIGQGCVRGWSAKGVLDPAALW